MEQRAKPEWLKSMEPMLKEMEEYIMEDVKKTKNSTSSVAAGFSLRTSIFLHSAWLRVRVSLQTIQAITFHLLQHHMDSPVA